MRENRFQKTLAAGATPVGHMISEFAVRSIARLASSADLDFVVIDMEHNSFSTDRVADLLSWFRYAPPAAFVRVPQRLYHFIAGIMDAGALGVMVANVESVEQAREVVDAVKYAPLGKRGVGLGGAHTDYLVPEPKQYFDQSNAGTTVICQIESAQGVENAPAIAGVDGVDVLWVGHYDLSQSMGIPGAFDDPRFIAATERVAKAARDQGKAAGVQPGSLAMAEEWLGRGYNVISWKSDAALYRAALVNEVAELRRRL